MNAYSLAVQCGAKAICAILPIKVWTVWAVQHGQPRPSNLYGSLCGNVMRERHQDTCMQRTLL